MLACEWFQHVSAALISWIFMAQARSVRSLKFRVIAVLESRHARVFHAPSFVVFVQSGEWLHFAALNANSRESLAGKMPGSQGGRQNHNSRQPCELCGQERGDAPRGSFLTCLVQYHRLKRIVSFPKTRLRGSRSLQAGINRSRLGTTLWRSSQGNLSCNLKIWCAALAGREPVERMIRPSWTLFSALLSSTPLFLAGSYFA